MNKLISEVDSEYFPTNKEQAISIFNTSPLLKARKSLIRNFILILIKRVLNESEGFKENIKLTSALGAVESIHREIYTATLDEKLSELFKSVNDSDLHRTFPLLQYLDDIWLYLTDDIRLKLKAFVRNLPATHIEELAFLLTHSGLSDSAKRRVKAATRSELSEPWFFEIPEELGDRIVDLYATSGSFSQANNFAVTVRLYSTEYTKAQVLKLLKACGENFEIRGSFESGTVISSLRKNQSISNQEFDDLLRSHDLHSHIKEEDG